MKLLTVNPIACKGHGLCDELLPERITLDEWGYPIVDPEPVPAALELYARQAVTNCPTMALRLRIAQGPAPDQGKTPNRGGPRAGAAPRRREQSLGGEFS